MMSRISIFLAIAVVALLGATIGLGLAQRNSQAKISRLDDRIRTLEARTELLMTQFEFGDD